MKIEKWIFWVIGVAVVFYLVKSSGVFALGSSTSYSVKNVSIDPGGTGAGGAPDVGNTLVEYDGSGDD